MKNDRNYTIQYVERTYAQVVHVFIYVLCTFSMCQALLVYIKCALHLSVFNKF